MPPESGLPCPGAGAREGKSARDPWAAMLRASGSGEGCRSLCRESSAERSRRQGTEQAPGADVVICVSVVYYFQLIGKDGKGERRRRRRKEPGRLWPA